VQAVPETRMVVYTPDDDVTRAAMERLVAAGAPFPRFACPHSDAGQDRMDRNLLPQPV
jgi:hypothetical protein